MSVKCNIQDSQEAYNHGVKSFKEAFLQTQGDTTKSLKYAMNEVKAKFPNLDFDPKSFTDPIIEKGKKSGVIPASYTFDKKVKTPSIEKGKENIEAAKKKYEEKIKDITDKVEGANKEQKASMARSLAEKAIQTGFINDADVKKAFAEAVRLPVEVSEEFDAAVEKLQVANRELDTIDVEMSKLRNEVKDLKKEGKFTEEQNKSYDEKLRALVDKKKKAEDNATKAAYDLNVLMPPSSFWYYDMVSAANLNLMKGVSLINNLTGGLSDTAIRLMGNFSSEVLSLGVNSIIRKQNPLPFGKRALGSIQQRKKIAMKIASTLKYGNADIRDLAPTNTLDAVAKLRQKIENTPTAKLKKMAGFILRVHPDAVSRVLGATDAAFNTAIYFGELNSIAESKGLKGFDKTDFIENPDAASKEFAKKKADEATFKGEFIFGNNVVKALKVNPYSLQKMLTEEQGVPPLAAKLLVGTLHSISVGVMPFVKTPIAIFNSAQKLLLPEYAMLSGALKASREKDPNMRQRIVYEATGNYVAGTALRYAAINMIANGLMSGAYGDDDFDAADTTEKVMGGPNRINISAFMRGIAFQGWSSKKGDTIIELKTMGVPGVVLGAYAHAFHGQNNKQKMSNEIMSIEQDIKLLGASFQSFVDNTFLSGTNQLLQALTDKEGHKWNKFTINLASVLLGGAVPSTAQTFSTQMDENVKQQYNKDLDYGENLANILGYKFAFQSKDLKNKYFNLAAENEALKKKKYVFFDNYLGRVIANNVDFLKMSELDKDTPEYKLYEYTQSLKEENRPKLFPSAVEKNVNVSYTERVNGLRTTKSEKVKLTNEEHEYYMKQASQYRLMLVTPYIMQEKFKDIPYDEKIKEMAKLYESGKDMAKKDLMSQFPDLTKRVKTEKVEDESDL